MLMAFLLNLPACVAKRYRPWVQNIFCFCGGLLFIGAILVLVGFSDLAMSEGEGAILPPGDCKICSPDSSAFQIGECELGYSLIVMLCTCGVAIVTACMLSFATQIFVSIAF